MLLQTKKKKKSEEERKNIGNLTFYTDMVKDSHV